MTVFKRLFRPAAPGAPTATPEAGAVARAEAESLAEAGRDAEQAAPVAALTDITELRRLAGPNTADAGEAVRRAAQQRLLTLLESGSVTDEAQLAELALHGPTPAVRQRAAEGVHSPERVAAALREARGGDKNVYRILKATRDAQHAAERAAEAQQAHLAVLCASLERHVHQPYGHAYVDALEHLENEWRTASAPADDTLRSRAEAALHRCREVITRQVQQQAQLAAEQAAQEMRLERARTGRVEVLQSLQALLPRAVAAEEPEATARLAELQSAWREVAALQAAPRDEQREFERLVHALDTVTAFNTQHGSAAQAAATLVAAADNGDDTAAALRTLLQAVPESLQASPGLTAAAAALHDWDAARGAHREAAATQLRQLQGLLRKAQAALAAGHSREANGLRRAIEDKLPALADVPASLTSALQAFDARLGELQEWRRYAVAPKRIELIVQMEALIGSELPPPELATQIKRLQDEWKLISQGNTEDTQAEWQRFHEAAQKAYEPCKAHFTEQAALRAAQLEKRRALLERLQAFATGHDWENADWPLVARALRESALQWRSLQPVERAANRPLQAAFDALRGDLQARLDAEYANNVAARETLITRAQQATALDDARQATDAVKRLQAEWQALGPVAHDDNQRLWQAFRAQCDAAFARRQQQNEQQATQRGAQAEQAAALCLQAEQLAELNGPALQEGVRGLQGLWELLQSLSELSRAHVLRTRFERAARRAEELLGQQRAREQLQVWERVYEAADGLRRYRLARSGADAAGADAAHDSLRALLDAEAPWPKGMLALLKAEVARETSADLDANEATLRLLCVRAELLVDAATPEGDLPLRRQYQMQQLTRGLGQARVPRREGLEALLREWLAVGASRDADYATLLVRFRACRDGATG